MPGRMTPEDWERQNAFINAMSPEERDAARAAELTRSEAVERLKAELARVRAELPPEDREALSTADAAREAYARIREEGRPDPADIVTVRGFASETSGPGGSAWEGVMAAGAAISEGIRKGIRTPDSTIPLKLKPEAEKVMAKLARGENPFIGGGSAGGKTRADWEAAGRPGPYDDWVAGVPAPTVNKEPGKALEKWADVAMWRAPDHTDPQTPIVTITVAPEDPLGIMAMVNGMYTGKVYSSPSQVSDEERREAWEAFAVSRLSETPAEWFQLSILFENVTRAFTHQLVRTRVATYAQESQRFAVKPDMAEAVKLPPSLAGTEPHRDLVKRLYSEGVDPEVNLTTEQKWRALWDAAVSEIGNSYSLLVDSGMPAEDARGLLPTNILTRVHDRLDIKTLLGVAGMRLCTQAQFEWREVFAKLVQALREYLPKDHPNRWQYELIAERFRPVCFAANKCPMKAKSDRACSIRAQVDDFEHEGVPSSEWEKGRGTPAHAGHKVDASGRRIIIPIRPAQWLADPTAARAKP